MKRGVLKFVASPMNGGKTTNMLLRAKRASILGWKVLLAKPQIDTRHRSATIKSRCGAEMECDLCVDSRFNFMKDISYKDVDILFVDEAQFLSTRQIEELREVVDVHKVSIWCYGLLTDFKKNLFEGSRRLVELCDKMYELDVLCCFCSESGRFHLKCNDGKGSLDGPSIDISTPGNDKFVSVCHMCWTEKMSASKEVECPTLFCGEGVPVDKALEING